MRGVEEDCHEWADRNQLTFQKDQQCLATFIPEIATSHCLLCHHNHGPVIIPMHLRYCLPFPYQSMGQPHPWPSAVPRGRIKQLQGFVILCHQGKIFKEGWIAFGRRKEQLAPLLLFHGEPALPWPSKSYTWDARCWVSYNSGNPWRQSCSVWQGPSCCWWLPLLREQTLSSWCRTSADPRMQLLCALYSKNIGYILVFVYIPAFVVGGHCGISSIREITIFSQRSAAFFCAKLPQSKNTTPCGRSRRASHGFQEIFLGKSISLTMLVAGDLLGG